MIIKNINIEIQQDYNDVNYLNQRYSVPSRQEIIAKIDAILDVKEYEELNLMFRSQTQHGGRNLRLANLIKNTITEDILLNNKENETFLLSLINGDVCVIAKEETYSFRNYAEKHMPEFYEKYKLLMV